jgi:hypothetical protein
MAPGLMLDQMKRLLQMFAATSPDRTTLDVLVEIIEEPRRWTSAHGLFDQIRRKGLSLKNAASLCAQYRFEEACAKTLYNLSGTSAPFDPESPYWIVPRALEVARHGIGSTDEVLKIVGEVPA